MPPPGPLDGHFSKGRGADNAAGAAGNFHNKRKATGEVVGRDNIARQRLKIKRLEKLVAAAEKKQESPVPMSLLELYREVQPRR